MVSTSEKRRSRPSGNLVVQVSDDLRQSILSGEFKPGAKLPSEAKLTEAFGVSRTVVREAIAALRADRLVEARQGAGVFVLEAPVRDMAPFQNLDYQRISSVIELLELRIGVEMEAAGLAALRHSAQQEENIINAHREIMACLEAGKPTAIADFALHLAIADATNNSRFSEFLKMIGSGIIPRFALDPSGEANSSDYIAHLHDEHASIIAAISNRDEEGAREAMRHHLKGSLTRYRSILRRAVNGL